MVKQPAWAAAINSSGLKRVLNEYGVSESTPESLERLPLPARPVPCHIALALRTMRFFLARSIASALCARAPSLSGSRRTYRPLRGNRLRSSSAAELTNVEAKPIFDVSSAMEATFHQCLQRWR